MARYLIIPLLWLWVALPCHAFDVLQALPDTPPIPADSPRNTATVALGKQLFFDPRLSVLATSGTGQQSCNACHNVMLGADGGQALSLGLQGQSTYRNAPTLWNVAFQTVLFWEGRAISLEQAIAQHLNDKVIASWPNLEVLASRLNSIPGYREQFKRAYGPENVQSRDIVRALSSYIRTLLTPDSAFDRFIQGDKTAISALAEKGLETFNNVGCMSCHFGVNFAGPAPGPYLKMGDGFYELFPNYLGSLEEVKYKLADDKGRIQYTGKSIDLHKFRVPPLRNIAMTAPYFHNGAVSTLSEAIRVMARTELNQVLTDAQVREIKVFLETLTGQRPTQTMPELPVEAVR